jgi:hypothetical protein
MMTHLFYYGTLSGFTRQLITGVGGREHVEEMCKREEEIR